MPRALLGILDYPSMNTFPTGFSPDHLSFRKAKKAQMLAMRRFSETLVKQLPHKRSMKPTIAQADQKATLRKLHRSLEMDIGDEDILRWKLYDVTCLGYLYT